MSVIESKPPTVARGTSAPSRVLVVLAGGTAPSPITRTLGCSLLDVEIAPGQTLLEWWCGRDWGAPGEMRRVRIVRGAGSFAPETTPAWESLDVQHLVDRSGPRGSAGALRDACESDPADTTIIAVESSTAVFAPLEPLLARHAESRADATVVTTASGRAAGITLLRRGALDLAKPRGYFDLKEQLLPAMAGARLRIQVLKVADRDVLPMHDRRGVLNAVWRIQELGPRACIEAAPRGVVDPTWKPSIVSRSAAVDGDATLSASLVLCGAKVGAGAVVARSIVAPGAVVAPRSVVIDGIVASDRVFCDEQLPLEARRDPR